MNMYLRDAPSRRSASPACRNWQTRQTQNLLTERPCGFDSRRRHDPKEPKNPHGFPALSFFRVKIVRQP